MNANRWFNTALLIMAGFSILLSGCVVAPAPYYVGEPVPMAPPPPRTEVIGVAPAVGYIWIGGYWDWDGRHYDWKQGHWTAPRPGYHWAPRHWEHEGHSWRPYGGHWEKKH